MEKTAEVRWEGWWRCAPDAKACVNRFVGSCCYKSVCSQPQASHVNVPITYLRSLEKSLHYGFRQYRLLVIPYLSGRPRTKRLINHLFPFAKFSLGLCASPSFLGSLHSLRDHLSTQLGNHCLFFLKLFLLLSVEGGTLTYTTRSFLKTCGTISPLIGLAAARRSCPICWKQ